MIQTKPSNSLLSFTFWFLFAFCFLLSGTIAYSGLAPWYKLGYLPAILVITFIITLRVRVYYSYLFYFFTIISILLSSITNSVNFIDIALYLRYPVFFFLIMWIVDLYINIKNVRTILKAICFIAILQLPVVILQVSFKQYFAQTAAAPLATYDTAFGTFNFSTDYAMSYFLIFVVVLLLNCKAAKKLMPFSKIVFIISIVTILISGSETMKMMLIIVIMTNYMNKNIFFFSLLFITIVSSSILIININIYNPDILNDAYENNSSVKYVVDEMVSLFDDDNYKGVEIEGFSRPAVIKHALSQPITWVGTGPHSVYNPITRVRNLPTTDTFLITYFEIGFLGLLSIILLFYSTFFRLFSKKYTFSTFQIYTFSTFITLCFIVPIFPDIAVIMTTFIFLKIYVLLNENNK